MLIKPKNPGQLVRALSGLFITKDNPSGITPKESMVLACMLGLVGSKIITKELKQEISNQLNQSLQVTTNYVNGFRKKRIIIGDKINPIFFTKQIIIQYAETGM